MKENVYRFDIYSYGNVTDSIEVIGEDKAKYTYMVYQTMNDIGFKMYKNGELIPYQKIKSMLGIDYNYVFQFTKEHSIITQD